MWLTRNPFHRPKAWRDNKLVLVVGISPNLGSVRTSITSTPHLRNHNRNSWNKECMKKILLIIDPQDDFISGSLAVNGARQAIDALTSHLLSESEVFDYVIITSDSHPHSHCSFTRNGGIWPDHCVIGTPGWGLDARLAAAISLLYTSKCRIVDKGMNPDVEEYSVLSNPDNEKELLPILKEASEVHICGIAGDFCVAETIKDLIKLDLLDRLVIRKDYIASTDSGNALNELISDFGIKCG